MGGGKEEPLVLTGTVTDASGKGKEDTKKEEEAASRLDSKAALSSEEKMKLLSLYGCESDEDEYPFSTSKFPSVMTLYQKVLVLKYP